MPPIPLGKSKPFSQRRRAAVLRRAHPFSGKQPCSPPLPSTTLPPSHSRSSVVRWSPRATASTSARSARRASLMRDPLPSDDEAEPWSAHASQPGTAEATYYRPGAGPVCQCPFCQSPRTEPRHTSRRIGGAIGAAAGATSAIALTLSGAEAGATAGLIGGPFGAACGGIAGAVLAGLVAGAAGCATGAACGEAIDQKVLDNWRCLACGRTFSVHPR
jgi:hypothetical protein